MQTSLLPRGRERAEHVGAEDPREIERLPALQARARKPVAQRREGREDVALHVQLARDVGTTEAELTRRGDEPAEGIG